MSLREKVGVWWLRRQWKRGLEGKEGENVKNTLQKIQGLRSAIIALLLLAEFLGQKLGLGGGLLSYTGNVIRALGWNPSEALFDPTVVGAALLTLWATWKRFVAWRADLQRAEARDLAARLAKVLLLAVLLPGVIACGSMAQLQIGANREHPDEQVVRSYVCQEQGDAARIYLLSPTYAWLGPARERYLVDALEFKRAGGCGCPANTPCNAPALAR